jgi:hypothetical protein
MNRLKWAALRHGSRLAWLLLTWLAARRRRRGSAGQYQRHIFRTQVRGAGIRMTEFLRDRLRPGWLRVRRGDKDR